MGKKQNTKEKPTKNNPAKQQLMRATNNPKPNEKGPNDLRTMLSVQTLDKN